MLPPGPPGRTKIASKHSVRIAFCCAGSYMLDGCAYLLRSSSGTTLGRLSGGQRIQFGDQVIERDSTSSRDIRHPGSTTGRISTSASVSRGSGMPLEPDFCSHPLAHLVRDRLFQDPLSRFQLAPHDSSRQILDICPEILSKFRMGVAEAIM